MQARERVAERFRLGVAGGPALPPLEVGQLAGQPPHPGEAEVDVEVVAEHRTGEVRHRGPYRVPDRGTEVVAGRRGTGDGQQLVAPLLVRRPRRQERLQWQRVRLGALVVQVDRLTGGVQATNGDLVGVCGGERVAGVVPGQVGPVDHADRGPASLQRAAQVLLRHAGAAGAGDVVRDAGAVERSRDERLGVVLADDRHGGMVTGVFEDEIHEPDAARQAAEHRLGVRLSGVRRDRTSRLDGVPGEHRQVVTAATEPPVARDHASRDHVRLASRVDAGTGVPRSGSPYSGSP